ncbi:MAG: SDH family Clp fold serine proteinase [Anaerolineae bacterium]
MSLFDLFWIVFIILSLQPVIRQKMLEASRARLIHQLEQKRNSRVIVLVHRQETITFLGLPLVRYIDIEDSEAILRAIRLTSPDVPLDVILHTPGGLVLAAEQIAAALCRHKAKVTVLVPHYAMSGGSLIALAADEIIMDENAVLGPVDPQLGQYPAHSIVRVVREKPVTDIEDETLILADVAAKAIDQVKHMVRELVAAQMAEAGVEDAERKAQKIADILAGGNWTHDYPISVQAARALSLPISTDMPREVYELMNLFPQTRQRRPSVEYIPVPYRRRETPEPPGAAR